MHEDLFDELRIKAFHAAKQQAWLTPPELFHQLEEELGLKFTLDPCTEPDNPLGTPTFYTEEDDGLKQDWARHVVYMNPPYTDLTPWLKKAYYSRFSPNTIVVGLLPVRTSPHYAEAYIFTREARLATSLKRIEQAFHATGQRHGIWIHFLPSRVSFLDPETRKSVGSPYFDSMVVVWK